MRGPHQLDSSLDDALMRQAAVAARLMGNRSEAAAEIVDPAPRGDELMLRAERQKRVQRAALENLAKLAGADLLDRGQLDLAYAELRERNMAVQKAIHVAVSDAIAGLTGGARR